MKLLLDQGTPRSAAAILRGADFDAVHTGEIGLAEAEDSGESRRGISQHEIWLLTVIARNPLFSHDGQGDRASGALAHKAVVGRVSITL